MLTPCSATEADNKRRFSPFPKSGDAWITRKGQNGPFHWLKSDLENGSFDRKVRSSGSQTATILNSTLLPPFLVPRSFFLETSQLSHDGQGTKKEEPKKVLPIYSVFVVETARRARSYKILAEASGCQTWHVWDNFKYKVLESIVVIVSIVRRAVTIFDHRLPSHVV